MSGPQGPLERRGPPIRGEGGTSYATSDPAEPLHPAYPLPFLQSYQASMYRDVHPTTDDRPWISLGWLSWAAGILGLLLAFLVQPVGLVLGIASVYLGYMSVRRREGEPLVGPFIGVLAIVLALALWGL